MQPRTLTTLLLLCLLSSPARAQDVLRLLTWPGYADQYLGVIVLSIDVSALLTHLKNELPANYQVFLANSKGKLPETLPLLQGQTSSLPGWPPSPGT